MAGHASAIALPGPPDPGTCLQVPTGTQVTTTTPPTLPQRPRFGRCDAGQTLGEVVTVHDEPTWEIGPPTTDDCGMAAAVYAGLLVTVDGDDYVTELAGSGRASDDPVSWRFPFAPVTQWVAQAPDLPMKNSTWFACVVQPPTGGQQGSLAAAFTGGRLPDSYGICWATAAPAPGTPMVGCGSPHLTELLGGATVADGGDGVPGPIEQSCHDLAVRLLGRDDPTAAGALTVNVWQGNPITGTSSRDVACYLGVTGDRPIEGSLIGLKAGAITYAG